MNYQTGFWILALLLVALSIASLFVLQFGAAWKRVAEANKTRGDQLQSKIAGLDEQLDAKQRMFDEAVKQRDDARMRNVEITREWSALSVRRNVAWVKPAKRMPASEVKRAFAVAADAPLWLALNQEVDDYLQDQLDQVSLPPASTMSEEMRLHLAGGVEHVRLFHKRLLELHAAAQKIDADLDADEDKKGGAA